MTEAENVKITVTVARDVLRHVDMGLPGGLGKGGDGNMCVQNVVATVVHGHRQSDDPICVIYSLRGVGINLNDADVWRSNKNRGIALRRFAIAELGTNSDGYVFDERKFHEKLVKRLRKRGFLPKGYSYSPYECDPDTVIDGAISHAYTLKTARGRECRVAAVAEEVVQVLIELETPGSKYLWLTE